MSTKTLSCPAWVVCSQNPAEALNVTITHRIYTSIDALSISERWSLVPQDDILLRHDYLASLEQANPDMGFRYVVLYRNQRVVGFAYFQILPLDWEPLEAYSSNSSNKFVNWLGQQLVRRMLHNEASLLVCGNVFVSGDFGFRFENLTRFEAMGALAKVAEEIRRKEKNITATVMKDLQPEDDACFSLYGYNCFFADPNMVLQISPGWKKLEDYTDAMSSKYRQRARSAYKKSQGLEVKTLEAADLRTHQSEMMALFHQMIKEETFNIKNISSEYFIQLKENLGRDFPVRAYFQEGKMVAFFTSMVHKNRMEAHYVGFDTTLNKTLKLYQRMLYDMVELAIQQGADALSFGRTAMEIKSCLGAEPEELGAFLRMSNPVVNKVIGPNVRKIAPDPWTKRNPFKEDYDAAPSSKKHSLHLGS